MNIRDIVEQAGYTTRSYSGRYMYDKYCVGVEVEDVFKAIARFIVAADEMSTPDDTISPAEKLAEAIRSAKTDGMGLGSVLYFPNVKWEPEWDIGGQDVEAEDR